MPFCPAVPERAFLFSGNALQDLFQVEIAEDPGNVRAFKDPVLFLVVPDHIGRLTVGIEKILFHDQGLYQQCGFILSSPGGGKIEVLVQRQLEIEFMQLAGLLAQRHRYGDDRLKGSAMQTVLQPVYLVLFHIGNEAQLLLGKASFVTQLSHIPAEGLYVPQIPIFHLVKLQSKLNYFEVKFVD